MAARRCAVGSLATAIVVMMLLVGPRPAGATTSFTYTGGVQYYTVPGGIYTVSVDAYGAQGGGSNGGLGARTRVLLAVMPGDSLAVYVGGRGGTPSSTSTRPAGGWNGGGAGGTSYDTGNPSYYRNGGGGGGATDIRRGGTALSNRVVIAGGGGGMSFGGISGGGAGYVGSAGQNGPNTGAVGGGGGTQVTGGAAGGGGTAGGSGAGGQGADIVTSGNNPSGGGGGGAGLYGGGGGAASAAWAEGAGGGGGSSWARGTDITYDAAARVGDGAVTITPEPGIYAFFGASQPYVVPTGVTALTIEASGAAGGYAGQWSGRLHTGGLGGRLLSMLLATPGETLNVFVGGGGADGGTFGNGAGGWNGGAAGGAPGDSGGQGAGGGGASDVRRGGTALSNRIVAAGGGGGGTPTIPGGGEGAKGGHGGGTDGQRGSPDESGDHVRFGGLGGSQLAGGAGASGSCVTTATAGGLGFGGSGSSYAWYSNGEGGGGGGGYYGGGGGGTPQCTINGAYYLGGGGGGGGSSYTSGSRVTHTQGAQAGAGKVVVRPKGADAPSSFSQFRTDGTTSIATGEWQPDTALVLRFDDAHPGGSQTLTPWVEVRPYATAFTATCGQSVAGATYSGTAVAAPTAGVSVGLSVTVSGLVRGTRYIWRACAVDAGSTPGDWGARGGAPDFGVSQAPGVPTLVSPADGTVTTGSTPSFTATFSDADTGQSGRVDFRICADSACTSVLQSGSSPSGIASGGDGTWTSAALSSGSLYYWQARNTDSSGMSSAWSASRSLRVDTAPIAPTLLTPGDGGVTSDSTPTLTARFDDPDAADTGQLEFEVCTAAPTTAQSCADAGGTLLASGSSPSGIANGSSGSWTVPSTLAAGTYHWRARSTDAHGISGPFAESRSLLVGAPSITVSVDAVNVALSGAPILPGVNATGATVVSVSTDNATGYTLWARDGSDAAGAMHSDGVATVPDWSGSVSAPTSWASGTAGYFGITLLAATGGKDTTRWGIGSTSTDYANLRYAGLPAADASIHVRPTNTSTTDAIELSYRVNSSSSQKAGSYSANVTYTATMNP